MRLEARARRGGALAAALLWVSLLTALAFVLRLYRLAGPVVLRWDEGWSLAHASLPWPQLWQVATEEWHPPAYVALLKLWLVAGRGAWSIRYLSALLGTAAVPLAYQVAREWSGRQRVAILAAALAACWPLLVYYGQVTRMYALGVLPVLGAAWFILRSDRAPSWKADLGLVLCAVTALYCFYPTAWALAGLWLYAAVSRPRRFARLFALGLVALLAYAPWLLAARTTLQERVAATPAAGGDAIRGTIALLKPALDGLAFAYGTRRFAPVLLWLVLAAGLVASPWSRPAARKLLLPLFVVGLTLLGTAYGARSYWFAARHLVPGWLFLGLALAWALDSLGRRWWPLLPLALLALAVAYWPASSRYVYEKMLEVTDPFDPAADHRYLAEHCGPQDLVYFNVLARAGWYESLRGPQDPAWSYAMRWDPIVEPLERIAARIRQASRTRPRLWFALYKGNYGPNASLGGWLDANLYPAGGEWQGDMLYLAYAAPPTTWAGGARDDRFEQGVRLKEARWTADGQAGGALALELTWEADRPLKASYKVFVHAVDDAGQLVAQHDALPGTGAQPTNTWQPGVGVLDRHGLLLPAAGATGPTRLRIQVGLYDPDSGQRLHLLDGRDAVDICSVTME